MLYSTKLSIVKTSLLREKIESFILENVSNLIHEFLYDNFNMKILLYFLVKIAIQKLMC